MSVNNVPLLVLPRQAKHTVKPRERILSVDRQMENFHFAMQLGLQLPSSCCQKDLMPVGNLFRRKLYNVTFHAPLFKLRDDVKNSHVIHLFLTEANGSISIPQPSLLR